MTSFDDTYTCPDCQRTGAPISDEASADEYASGWHITCPECGFSVSGPNRRTVSMAVSVLAAWQARVANLTSHAESRDGTAK